MDKKVKDPGIWPWLVLTIGISFLMITGWSVYQAAKGTSPVTDPAYYSHGLKYNQTRIEVLAAESLGWKLSSLMEKGRLTFTLQNEKMEPVTGCQGELLLFNSHSRVSLTLQEEKSGSYTVELPFELTGNLTGDLLMQRDGARLNRRLLINL